MRRNIRSLLQMNICGILLCILLFMTMPAAHCEEPTEDQAYQAAVAQYNQKQWDKAQQSFLAFQSAFPKSRWRYAVALRLADVEADPAKALQLYEEVLAHAPESEWSADALWGKAVSLFMLGQYKQSVDYLGKVEATSKNRKAHALYLAGLCYTALKKHEEAQKVFQQVLTEYQTTSWAGLALVGAGEAALALKNPSEALTLFDRYLREYPEGDLSPVVLMQKSKAYEQQGMGDKATRMLHELMTRYTESFEAEKAKGKIVEGRKKYTIQVGAFSKEAYAEKLVKRLRKKGYNAYILKAKSGDELFNQVRVGSYTTREFSEKIAKKLAEKEQLPYIILPYVQPDTP